MRFFFRTLAAILAGVLLMSMAGCETWTVAPGGGDIIINKINPVEVKSTTTVSGLPGVRR